MPFKFNPFTGNLDYYYDETGVNTGDVTLTTIGSSPNANAATLNGQILNFEPASASFGGVVTTGTQTFAGDKTFNGVVAHKLGTAALPAIVPTGDVDTGIWSSGANSWSVSTTATERIRIGVANSGFINIHGNFTSQTYGMLLNGMTANVPTLGLRLANSQSANLVDLVTYAGTVFGSITKDGYLQFIDGNASTPGYSFFSDTNTGIYRVTADEIGISLGGTQRADFRANYISLHNDMSQTNAALQVPTLSTTIPNLSLKGIASQTANYVDLRNSANTIVGSITVDPYIKLASGSASAPTYTFYGDTKYGMYHPSNETRLVSEEKYLGVTKNGNIKVICHENAEAVGDSTKQEIRSGESFTPTFNNLTDITISVESINWLRIGNEVTVSVYGKATTSSYNYSFEMDLPVSSDFTNDYKAGGIGVIQLPDKEESTFSICAEVTNNTVYCQGYDVNGGGLSDAKFNMHFTYTVEG